MPAHHPVPNLEPGDTGADRDHFASRLAARDEGRLRPELVFTGQHQDVDILRAARLNSYLDVTGTGWRWVWHFAQGKHLGTTERLADDRLHPAPPYSAASARTGASCCKRNFSKLITAW